MKCFHFSNGAKRDENGSTYAGSRVPWVRSFRIASNNPEGRRSKFDLDSKDVVDVDFNRRSNYLRVFEFSELRTTRSFSRALMIGGGFGGVYRGVVRVSDDSDAEIDVAVKQLNRNGWQGHKEWVTEVNYLGVVKHPNLVKLVGYCAEDDERGIQRFLVYELMPNKSLEDHLLSRTPESLLFWFFVFFFAAVVG